MDNFRSVVLWIGTAIDGIGVAVVFIGTIIATVHYVQQRPASTYHSFRQDLGRAILLGLEFLVAGDIIRTVVVSPTLQNVIVLALIVLVRTFLSWALQLELEGRWPWSGTHTK